jgi:hypothetical protein
MTDYSHQSLNAILKDLSDWLFLLARAISYLESNQRKIIDNGYWDSVNGDYKWIFARSYMFFETALSEIEEIRDQLPIEVQSNHVERLNRIGVTSHEIYREWSDVWVNDVKPKQYGNPNFLILEDLRNCSGDMIANLLDLSNAADRLKDFIGRKSNLDKPVINNNHNEIHIHGNGEGNFIIGNNNEVNS